MAADITDPLEAAKMDDVAEAPKSSKSSKKSKAKAKPDQEPKSAGSDELEEQAAAKEPPPRPPAKEPPAPARYRVLAKRTISMGPQMVTFHRGKVLSSTSYDIEKLIKGGVELELVEE